MYHRRSYYHLQKAGLVRYLCGRTRTSRISFVSHRRSSTLDARDIIPASPFIDTLYYLSSNGLLALCALDNHLGFTIPHYLIHQRSHPGELTSYLITKNYQGCYHQGIHYAANEAQQIELKHTIQLLFLPLMLKSTRLRNMIQTKSGVCDVIVSLLASKLQEAWQIIQFISLQHKSY